MISLNTDTVYIHSKNNNYLTEYAGKGPLGHESVPTGVHLNITPKNTLHLKLNERLYLKEGI